MGVFRTALTLVSRDPTLHNKYASYVTYPLKMFNPSEATALRRSLEAPSVAAKLETGTYVTFSSSLSLFAGVAGVAGGRGFALGPGAGHLIQMFPYQCYSYVSRHNLG